MSSRPSSLRTRILNLGLQAKLLWVTVLLSVVPLLLLGVFTYQTSQAVLLAVSDRQIRSILAERRLFVRNVMEEVESLIANVSGQDVLKAVLDRPTGNMSDYDRLATQAKIGYVLSGYINLKGLVSIDVFAPGGTTFHVGDTLDVSETRMDIVRRLMKAAAASSDTVYWSGLEDNINSASAYAQVITAVKRLPSERGDPAEDSLLVVSYDPAMLSQTDFTDSQSFSVILDANNRIVTHPDQALWGKPAPASLLAPVLAHRTAFAYTDARGSFDARSLALDKGNWTLIHFASTRSLQTAQLVIAAGTIVALLLALTLVLYLGRLVTRSVIRPILQITEGFRTLQVDASGHPGRLSFDGRDEIGTLVLWYNAFLDTFEEKRKTDLELRELNQTLEQRVEAEVSANREKDSMLIQQSRQASMGEMIGNIAHQWRQPLNTAALLVQELQMRCYEDQLDRPAVDKFADDLLGVIDQMSSTIDDFRDFFKPNKAKVEFSVEAAVLTALSFVEPAFKNHSIRVVVETANPGMLSGYPNEFSQVVLNILNNAQDVLVNAPADRRAVRLRLGRKEGRPTVSIADSGGGIPDAIVEKIFDPYFTTKGPGKGTGIGLFLCKTIIERNMGGRILVRNTEIEPGLRGAEFTLEL
jgi:signal transduction histidine kinase